MFVGDWPAGSRRVSRRPPRPPADRRPARRPVGRARRLDRVRDGDRRRPRRPRPRRSSQVLIDLDGGWWWLPAGPSPRRPARRRLRRSGGARRATGPLTAGAAIDRLAAARPAAGRLHRPPRAVRRGRHGPGAARGGRPRLHRLGRGGLGARAWTRPLFKRLCRGLGLPVVDWREVRAARWAGDPAAVLGRARGVRRRRPATRG